MHWVKSHLPERKQATCCDILNGNNEYNSELLLQVKYKKQLQTKHEIKIRARGKEVSGHLVEQSLKVTPSLTYKQWQISIINQQGEAISENTINVIKDTINKIPYHKQKLQCFQTLMAAWVFGCRIFLEGHLFHRWTFNLKLQAIWITTFPKRIVNLTPAANKPRAFEAVSEQESLKLH